LRRHQGENPDRWIQFNHPDLTNMFLDRDTDGIANGGFVGVGTLIDGTETQNGNETAILEGAPFRISRSKTSLAAKATPVREFIWLQLLNQGHRLVAVGVADAHAVYGNGVGGWHIYLEKPHRYAQGTELERPRAPCQGGTYHRHQWSLLERDHPRWQRPR